MKRLSFLVIAIVISVTTSCKKENTDTGFSQDIKDLVPSEAMNAMRQNGMTIYEGMKPPQIEGIYLSSEHILFGSSDKDDKIGERYADYRYQFFDQDFTDLSVKTSYNGYRVDDGVLIDQASGLGSFISGNGNFFSVFSEEHGETSSGAKYTWLAIYSGEITKDGIKNLVNSFYMKDKEDPYNKLVDIGTVRVFKDKDGVSETKGSLRISAEDKQDFANKIFSAKGMGER
ncbi:hypothetical protein QNI16_36945 [Cytophagaceae bacterium YF14B1]|uniref:Lipoprotein n=1 Tax=Xanthocytophaga flava TaxID=3048013 RepID=A0AAE3R0K7_9BACT|nr:hypothetical protein [Xanthocytophaga flavus]MDJ1467181.1 hypothetical protein [Xanthocytophaga flavus]MDJ1486129.1 hypothetical protein [Xanthocytophaga flavus]